MSLAHLMTSVVKVQRASRQLVNGQMQLSWSTPLVNRMNCRLDLLFRDVRQQAFITAEAGKAPDRVGTVYYPITFTQVRAGDRLSVIEGPLEGLLFEIEDAPEPAVGMSAHHYEAHIREITTGAPV